MGASGFGRRAGTPWARVSRRQWLAHAAALEAIPLLARASFAVDAPVFAHDPFTLGVASGDPDASSVVIWTRLAPARSNRTAACHPSR